MTATDTTRDAAEQRKHTCSNCLRGNHPSCTLAGRCQHFQCDEARPLVKLVDTDVPSHPCPECVAKFETLQSLGSHRFRAHGVRTASAASTATKDTADRTPPAAKKTEPLIGLVDEQPPPPPPPKAPKKKPAELILELVADLEPGEWKRCALFPTRQSARRMATRLSVDAPSYEWQASDDGRLFVRVAS